MSCPFNVLRQDSTLDGETVVGVLLNRLLMEIVDKKVNLISVINVNVTNKKLNATSKFVFIQKYEFYTYLFRRPT